MNKCILECTSIFKKYPTIANYSHQASLVRNWKTDHHYSQQATIDVVKINIPLQSRNFSVSKL